jgi:hypothetical protein
MIRNLLNTKNSVMFSRKTKAKKEEESKEERARKTPATPKASGPYTAMARRAEAIRAAAR